MTPLRDLTGGRPNIPIEVAVSPLFELAVAGWVLSDKETVDAHEHGTTLFDAARASLRPEDLDLVERMSVAGGALWLALFAIVQDLIDQDLIDQNLIDSNLIDRDPRDRPPAELRASVDDLVAALEDSPPDRLRMAMLSMLPHDSHRELEAAASGDMDMIEQIMASVTERHPAKQYMIDDLRRLLAMDGSELVADTVEAVKALATVVEGHLARVTPGLYRSADDARSLALTAPGERVVEQVTKGIEYQVRPGIDQIRLVPSAVVRPWSLMLEDGSTQIFVYPVGDELLGDPDTPPAGLVAVYKALADERRLRILRRIAGGGATFAELVEHLDLAKSTVHHHIGILRSAGLVRVAIGDGKETTYRLRAEVLPDAEQRLAHYLTEGDQP